MNEHIAFRAVAVNETVQPTLFGEPPPARLPLSGEYAEIVFDRPLDHAYSYAVPEALRAALTIGKRVLAPFGKGDRHTVGYCVGLTPQPPGRAVKNLLAVLDEESLLTPHLLKLTRWMADYYLCGWGQVLNAVLPAGVKQRAGTRAIALIELVPDNLWPSPPPALSAKQKAVIEFLRTKTEP